METRDGEKGLMIEAKEGVLSSWLGRGWSNGSWLSVCVCTNTISEALMQGKANLRWSSYDNDEEMIPRWKDEDGRMMEEEEHHPSKGPSLPVCRGPSSRGDGENGVGIEGWKRSVFQKDHLSCVRGSVDREGDSGAGWVLLSSPFKPFLHTGHVSCWTKGGGERGGERHIRCKL